MKIKILIPVYNDWQSLTILLKNINNEIEKLNQGFKLEKELAIKKGQEKAHKEYVRRYIYKKKKELESFSMGYLVRMAEEDS